MNPKILDPKPTVDAQDILKGGYFELHGHVYRRVKQAGSHDEGMTCYRLTCAVGTFHEVDYHQQVIPLYLKEQPTFSYTEK